MLAAKPLKWQQTTKNKALMIESKVTVIIRKVNSFVPFYLICSCQWLDHRYVFLFYTYVFVSVSVAVLPFLYHIYPVHHKTVDWVIVVKNNNRFSTKRYHFNIKTYKTLNTFFFNFYLMIIFRRLQQTKQQIIEENWFDRFVY